ncbi:MAG: hypothetical protein ABSF32_05250 [Ignavibacteria bacterium]|jgi:hypothetical protein
MSAKNIFFMKKIPVLIFILSVLLPGKSYSQFEKNGGSVYSIFGLGDYNYSSSMRTDAMGVLGISLGGNYTNSLNPACWTRIPTTKFSTKFNFANTRSSDGTYTSNRSYAGFDGFNLSIPVNPSKGLILDLGLNTMTLVNYDIILRGSSLGENYTQTYNGSGGISRISFGASYEFFKTLDLGAQFNYAFGNITKTNEIDFDNSSLFGTRNQIITSYSGVYLNSGLLFHGFDKLFKSKKLSNLTLGAFFSTPGYLYTKLSGNFKRVTNTDSIDNLGSGKVKLPWSGGIGLTNEFSQFFIVSADVFFQNWSSFQVTDTTGTTTHPPEIKNSLKAGIGMEFTPSRKFEASIYKRMSYRLGASYTQDYLKINGTSINAIGINAGLSIPLSMFNSLDLTFSYKTRGTTTNGLVKDNVYGIGASINIGELWFLKPKGE